MNSNMARRYSMKNKMIPMMFLVVLAVLWIVLFTGTAPAKGEKGFEAKRCDFCRMMLKHGEQAYVRGDYEKAGYYFQKAVQADPTQMAKCWFKQRGIRSEENTSEIIRPKPPAQDPTPCFKETEPLHLIIGDDEGC
jgi:hypothetical protein